MKKLRLFVSGALLVAVPVFAQPPGAGAPQTLTMEQAIEFAMQQQPSLRQSRAQLEAANGRVDQVAVNRRPTVTLSAGAVSAGGGAPFGVSTMSVGRDFFEPSVGFSMGISAAWRIYDFGQTAAQLKAAALSAKATAIGVDATVLDIKRSVEVSYLEAVARARLVVVSETTVKSEEAHLDQAKRFVAAQAKDPIEVAQAQARVANARAALAQAQSGAAIALANLRAAIGWVDPRQTIAVAQSWPAPPETTPPLVELVDTARKQRPEVAQLDAQVAAADATIDATKAQRRPTLSASGRTDWNPQLGEEPNQPAWSVGLTLSWQAYDGGRTSADLRVAKANRQSALAQRDALLLDLTSQLDASRAQIEANRAGVQSSNEAVVAARAQLKLADARYAQGLGSQIELSDAQTAVTTAEGNLISAEFQLATAWADLRRGLGGR